MLEKTDKKYARERKHLAFPFELVKDKLSLVASQITEQAQAFDPAIEGYVSYICDTSGKRIRPALAILAGDATGETTDDHLKLGTILELIHLATLVHDDIMDGADTRRGEPTASSKWGNSLSVLLGDCLFAHALTLSTEFDDAELSRKIARAASDVCTGEIIQTQRRFDLNLKVSEYYKIIEMKTAALFAVATELGARLSGASEEIQANLHDFGLKLGTAYQIYDDCLDLVGDEKVVGKTLGTDLEKGKLTLPLLNLIREATDAQKAKLNKLLLQNEPLETSVLAGIADYEGALEGALDEARDLLESAREDLVGLDESDYRRALIQVTHYIDSLLDDCRQ
jgi:octaprenyl-diphosphate synthase